MDKKQIHKNHNINKQKRLNNTISKNVNKEQKIKDIKKEKEKKDKPVRNKRILAVSILVTVIFSILIIRLFIIQFIESGSLKEKAYQQQTANLTITPKRGSIYDTNGKTLAISSPVDTVSINPKKVKYADNTEVAPEKLATIFSSVFGLEYEEVLEKIKSDKSVVTIAEKVESDKIELLKETLKENNITAGINIDADTKRYYPYDTLASNLIGFYGTDKGLEGLEARWESVLAGTSGKRIVSTDSARQEIPNQEQTYIPAQNGSNITLTIDVNIQKIVEKYLEQAVTEHNCKRGGNAIIMDPATGDILAMASYPNYNLNEPFSVDSTQWRNTAISNTYEPGSTFKLINAAIALEENIITDTEKKEFMCNGYEKFSDGTKINCWRYYAPHGSQSLRQALMNSCNPAFMQLGKRIGIQTMYKYYEAFGLFNTTGIPLYGEAGSIFHKIENVGEVELATISFGQRFNITPLQLITAISAIANDGVLMQPRLVKSIESTDQDGSTTTIEPVTVRQVISKETALKMLDMMETVVTNGTGQYASVRGYSIGGKTGTSEPNPDRPEDGKTASFVGAAPIVNPEVVILVTLYNPTTGATEGGSAAGPVVSQILSEVLPYLGIASSASSSSDASSSYTSKTLVDVRNKTVAEAKKILRNYGFNVVYNNIGENESETLVVDQVPKPGVKLMANSTVCLYSESSNLRQSIKVPNLKGKTLDEARNMLNAAKLNLNFEGAGIVINQSPAADTYVEEGSIVDVSLMKEIADAH